MACKDCGDTKNLEEHHISHEPEDVIKIKKLPDDYVNFGDI